MTLHSSASSVSGQQPALLPVTMLGALPISRLILGGNPFSGISHQTPDQDRAMVDYFTCARIKETLRQAEALGINALIARADRHIMRTLREYWNEGGQIAWLAQTAPEYGSLRANIGAAIAAGASAVYLHGGQVDNLCASQQYDLLVEGIAQIQAAGLPAGLAGHLPQSHRWANDHLPLDFHMCSYYNPSRRDEHAEHRPGEVEVFDDADRDAMLAEIATLAKPVIHYKIFAAGRNDPRAAFAVVARNLRPGDAVCVGIYQEHKTNMLAEDVGLFLETTRG